MPSFPGRPQLVKPIDIGTDEQWDVVYDGMVGALRPGGTAYASGVGAKYKIAGKTGTAQVFTIKQNENEQSQDPGRTQARSRLVHRLRAGR